MCGIAGCVLAPADYGFDMAGIVKNLGLGIEHRGHHATGVATVTHKNRVKLRKAPVTATKFFKERKGVGERARLAMIHTRFSTQGSEKVRENNHPIAYGNIIGAHNGMISNDFDIFRDNNYTRIAEVDSEAIFAHLHHQNDIRKALSEIEGGMAISWIDITDPGRLWLARGESSPLVWAMNSAGSLFYASEAQVLWELETAMYGKGSTEFGICHHANVGSIISYDPLVDESVMFSTFEPAPDRWAQWRSSQVGKATLQSVYGSTGSTSRNTDSHAIPVDNGVDPFDDPASLDAHQFEEAYATSGGELSWEEYITARYDSGSVTADEAIEMWEFYVGKYDGDLEVETPVESSQGRRVGDRVKLTPFSNLIGTVVHIDPVSNDCMIEWDTTSVEFDYRLSEATEGDERQADRAIDAFEKTIHPQATQLALTEGN